MVLFFIQAKAWLDLAAMWTWWRSSHAYTTSTWLPSFIAYPDGQGVKQSNQHTGDGGSQGQDVGLVAWEYYTAASTYQSTTRAVAHLVS